MAAQYGRSVVKQCDMYAKPIYHVSANILNSSEMIMLSSKLVYEIYLSRATQTLQHLANVRIA
jgi:hypothetical protein